MSVIANIVTFPYKEIKKIWNDRVPGEKPMLNGMRGTSILIIIYYHTCMYPIYSLFKGDTDRLHEFIRQIPPFISIIFGGDKAVEIFFLMSSFLLSLQLFSEISRTGTIGLKKFYTRRIFRIYPLFLVALLTYFLALRPSFYPNVVHSLIFIDNITNKTVVPVGWTLAVEVQFYLVLPFVILFCSKIKSYTPLFLSILLAASIAIRYFVSLSIPEIYETRWIDFVIGNDRVYMNNMYFPTYTRFGPLVIGMFWAYLYQSKKFNNIIKNLRISTALVIFTLATATVYISMRFPVFHIDSWYYQNFDPDINIWWITLNRAFFGVALVAIYILLDFKRLPAMLGKAVEGFFSLKIWRVLSILSYPMFFFHYPFVGLGFLTVFRTTDVTRLETATLWELFLSFVLASFYTLIFATILHRFVELPFMKKGKEITQSYRTKLVSSQK
ncbi:MAG: acyltransferase [Proteobacteria bacterium]|nr:acyltransferase [Pseudomonadota bacterium]